jgi:superfamily II DNA or RNA helicase
LFGRIVKVANTDDLIKQKHLAELKIKAILLQYPDHIREEHEKDTYQDEKAFLTEYHPRNEFIKNLALSLKENTLLLFERVEHGKELYNLIKSWHKGNVYLVHGGVETEEREYIRKIIESENDSITVASFGTFSTGTNVKNLHNLILASPGKSRIRILQSIGRGLRRLEGVKHSCTLFDIGDDLSWEKKKNITLKHFLERMKIYEAEKFPYKRYSVRIGK